MKKKIKNFEIAKNIADVRFVPSSLKFGGAKHRATTKQLLHNLLRKCQDIVVRRFCFCFL